MTGTPESEARAKICILCVCVDRGEGCFMLISSSLCASLLLFSSPLAIPGTGSFPMSQLFASGGQSIAASASASVLPMII